eukprot:m.262501 g.262501  ORF g.262501 m.262501 type:complete len:100 (-) comp49484_c0_seq1:193-492(-)
MLSHDVVEVSYPAFPARAPRLVSALHRYKRKPVVIFLRLNEIDLDLVPQDPKSLHLMPGLLEGRDQARGACLNALGHAARQIEMGRPDVTMVPVPSPLP